MRYAPRMIIDSQFQRANLEVHTPLTLELFLQWKAKKKEAQAAAAEAAQTKRRADISSGKVQMSGRELFAHNESLFVDDECAVDSSELQMEESVRKRWKGESRVAMSPRMICAGGAAVWGGCRVFVSGGALPGADAFRARCVALKSTSLALQSVAALRIPT